MRFGALNLVERMRCRDQHLFRHATAVGTGPAEQIRFDHGDAEPCLPRSHGDAHASVAAAEDHDVKAACWHASILSERLSDDSSRIRRDPTRAKIRRLHVPWRSRSSAAARCLTLPAFPPCAARRNMWFRTRRGSSAPPAIHRERLSVGRCLKKDLRREASENRRVRRRRVRFRL
jgi:hypothetical protein